MTDRPVAAGKSSFDLIDRDKFFSQLKLTQNTVFLDLASGVGRYSLEVAKRLGANGEVHAVDLWAEGIEALNETIREHHLTNIHTIIADITKPLPLTDSFYDICLLATVFHDLAELDRKPLLQEVYRLLKPNGILAVVEFKKIDHGPGPPVHIRLSEQELEEQIVPHGFFRFSCDELGQYTYTCSFRKKT
ncbi:MAG: class I SAM-dependent methyltransferase [Desulfobulbaceae bacterium]|nr:class I SAM-dependent methyltransferase [Desulfobulbaceae bacterium]